MSSGAAGGTIRNFVVSGTLVRDVVVVVVVGANVGCDGGTGFNGRTFNVGDGELLAWPFDGLPGRRGITSSRIVAG